MLNEEQNQLEVVKNKKSDSILSLLKNDKILTSNDWDDLESSTGFIKECFKSIPMYRPLPVKIFGVLNDKECPTPETKFWQCRKEAEVHADQLIEDIHNLEMIRINIDRANYALDKMKNEYISEKNVDRKMEIEFDLRETQVNLSKLEYRGIKLQKQIKYRIEEVHEWKKISENIKSSHNIETNSYIKQYVNNMRFNLIKKKNELSEENNKEELTMLDSQLNTFNTIIKQIESIKTPSEKI